MLKNSLTSDDSANALDAKSQRERKRDLGIYYTPPNAAEVLARWAIRDPKETVLEPSFGGCALLAAAVSIFESIGNTSPSNQLYGFDVDDTAFAHLEKMGINNENKHFKKLDFLQSVAADLRVDAVLANPPFVSYHRLNKEQRVLANQVRKQYMPHLPKLASLWAHFLLHSMSFLRENGRMAFVLPTTVGTADYARPLLAFLQSRFSQIELIHVSERLFIQAGADERISLLLLNGYAPAGLPSATRLLSKHVASIGEIVINKDSTLQTAELAECRDTRDVAAETLNALCNSVLVELGSVASVRIGEVVGDVRFFVKSLSDWKQLKIGSNYLLPLLTKSVQTKGIYVTKGRKQSDPSLIPLLLRPPERRVPQAIDSYLKNYSSQVAANNQTFIKRPVWYRCTYKTEADAFIGSISHDYPRIIANDAGISCSNAFYKIIIADRQDIADWLPILSLTTPLRLSAEVLGRVRGSGGIKLEPSDVKKLCIPSKLPNLTKSEFESLRDEICQMLQRDELEAASQMVDTRVFLETGLMKSKTLISLQKIRLTLTKRRLNILKVENE